MKLGHVLVVDEADKAPTNVTCILKTLVESGEMHLADGRRIVSGRITGSWYCTYVMLIIFRNTYSYNPYEKDFGKNILIKLIRKQSYVLCDISHNNALC